MEVGNLKIDLEAVLMVADEVALRTEEASATEEIRSIVAENVHLVIKEVVVADLVKHVIVMVMKLIFEIYNWTEYVFLYFLFLSLLLL